MELLLQLLEKEAEGVVATEAPKFIQRLLAIASKLGNASATQQASPAKPAITHYPAPPPRVRRPSQVPPDVSGTAK